MICSLQMLRFVAAMLVLLSHIHFADHSFFGTFPGVIGVDIFFILSGFVMFRSLANKKSALIFFYERCVRIYPMYILITLMVVAYKLLQGKSIELSHVATSIFLVPNYIGGQYLDPILVLGWTLQYEMFFYLFIAVARLTNLSQVNTIFVFFTLVCALSIITGDSLQILNSLLFEFLFGMMLCFVYDSRVNFFNQVSGIAAVVFIIIVTSLILGTTDDYNSIFAIRVRILFGASEYIRSLSWGLLAVIVVFASLCFGQRMPKSLESLSMRLGEISYAVYLVQYVVVPVVMMALLSPGASSLAIIFLTLMLSYLLTIYFDQPVRRLLSRF